MRWIGVALLAVGCGKTPEEAPKKEQAQTPRTPPSAEVEKPAPVPRAGGEPTATAPSGRKDPGPAPAGVSQVSDTRWQVTEALVDRWTNNPDGLGRVRQEGDGWALVNIRQRDAWHLGMRGGDVILEVNGHRLANQIQLLGAYMALKNDSKFDVVFERNGARKVHHYVIK